MLSETYESSTSCLKCELRIEKSIFFCPNCGTAILSNILNKKNTTANYDPTSRLLKPWREHVTLPPRVPLQEFRNKISWKPIMKNKSSTNLKKQVKVVISKNKSNSTSEENNDSTILFKAGVQSFQGLKFKRVGFDINKKYQENNVQSNPTCPVDKSESIERIEKKFYPLGVYSYNALPDKDIYIHISLYEIAKFPPSPVDDLPVKTLWNARWIRIGYTIEPNLINNTEQSEPSFSSSVGMDLIPLVILPNQIAKLILLLDTNYVDLADIDPNEYYMVYIYIYIYIYKYI